MEEKYFSAEVVWEYHSLMRIISGEMKIVQSDNSYTFHPRPGLFIKPLFKTGEKLEGGKAKDIYDDTCTLKPSDSVISYWIPLNNDIDIELLEEAINEKKVGNWDYTYCYQHIVAKFRD